MLIHIVRFVSQQNAVKKKVAAYYQDELANFIRYGDSGIYDELKTIWENDYLETTAALRSQFSKYMSDCADIEWDDGGNSGCLLKNLYASREELQKELKKEEEEKIAEIKAKIKDASDLVAFMYDHCVACAEEYTDWTARKAVKEIAKEMLGLDLD